MLSVGAIRAKLKAWWAWGWGHRTKVLGMAAVGVGYGQNNLAQLGHVLSAKWQGAILGTFGVLAFLLGLYNTFAARDEGAPP
jgi:hypothetical protein